MAHMVTATSGPKKKNGSSAEGRLLVSIDDLLHGGSRRHHKKINRLRDKFQLGRTVVVMQAGKAGTLVGGRRIMQAPDYSLKVSIEEDCTDKMREITCERGRITSGVPLTEAELTIYRGVSGPINRNAESGRPDLSAAAWSLPGQFNERDAKVLTELNSAVHLAKLTTMTVHAIPPEALSMMCFVDSWCDTSGKQRNQDGWKLGVSPPLLRRVDEVQRSSLTAVVGPLMEPPLRAQPRGPGSS